MKTLFLSQQAGRTLLVVKNNEQIRLWQEFYREDTDLKPGDFLLARVDKIQPAMGAAFLRSGEHILMLRREQTFLFQGKLLSGDAAFSSLKVSQTHWVQVIRAAEDRKNPLVTTQLKWKDWGLIWVWPADRISFSKKWQGPHQNPLSVDPPEGVGVIWRSAARSLPVETLQRAWSQLEDQWREFCSAQNQASNCHRPQDPLWEWLLEYGMDLDQIVVEGEPTAKRLAQILAGAPQRPHVLHHRGPGLMRDVYKLESVFQTQLQTKIWLPSGGYLEVKPGHALTVFDVNSGKASGTRKPGLALKTNLEAAQMIAQQILLRDLGGLIVVDFIDVRSQEERNKIQQQFQSGLASDPSKHQILPISALGLLEMSRQKRATGMDHRHSSDCPLCKGSGRVKSLLSRAYHLFDQALRRGVVSEPLVLLVGPQLFHWFQTNGQWILAALNDHFSNGVSLRQSVADGRESVAIGNED